MVAWKGTGLAVLAELSDTRAEHDGTSQSGHTTGSVNHAGTSEVDVAIAPVQRVPELGEPAATPGPCTEQRVVDGAAEQAPDHERLELPALSHRPGRDGGRGVHEGHHVEEERSRCAGIGKVGTVEPGAGPAALPQEHPVTGTDESATSSVVEAIVEAREQVAIATEHERPTHEEEADEPEEEDRQVRAHHVGGVLGPAEAGLDQREAGLHEDDQCRTDDDPQQVARLDGVIGGCSNSFEVGRRGLLGKGLSEGGPAKGKQCACTDEGANSDPLGVQGNSPCVRGLNGR